MLNSFERVSPLKGGLFLLPLSVPICACADVGHTDTDVFHSAAAEATHALFSRFWRTSVPPTSKDSKKPS